MKTTHVIIVIIVAALCLAQSLVAQSVDEIKSQAEEGDADSQGLLSVLIQLDEVALPDEKAVEMAKESNEAGSPFGSYALGRIYEKGYGGVSKDGGDASAQYATAIPGIRAKAESGNAWAELLMDACLSEGRGIDKDAAAATPWLRKAAEQGNVTAQRFLGQMFLSGEGVEKDPKEAMKWLRKAAEQGNFNAQLVLGRMFISGEGGEVDPKEAIKWLRKAAEQGVFIAQAVLAQQLSSVAVAQTEEQAWSQAMLSVEEAEKWLAAAASNPEPEASADNVVANAREIVARLKPGLAQMRNPSAADIGAMIDDANQKLNSNANVEDPEPGKFDGPDTQTVIQIVNLGFASAGDPSMVMTIKRGQPLVATEGGPIPAGTKIFPIRIKTGLIDYDYAFYQDPFGEWQAQKRSY